MGRRQTAGLRHAPAMAGNGRRQARGKPRQQLRRCCRAAITDARQRREVIIAYPGMLCDLPGDGRDADHPVQLLVLDQAHRRLGLEAVHEDEAMARVERRAEDREAPGHMEERHHDQRARLCRRHGRVGRQGPIAQGCPGGGKGGPGDVRQGRSVRRENALGFPRGARRVENRRGIVGLHGTRRLRWLGQPLPVAGRSDQVFEPACRSRLHGTAGEDLLERGTIPHQIGEALPSLCVGQQHLGARILNAEGELVSQPPRIERDGDRAERRRGEEADRPFGKIAHRDHHAIPRADAALRQNLHQRQRRAAEAPERDAPVVVDKKRQVIEAARPTDEFAHGLGPMFPRPARYAVDQDRLHFERSPRRGKLLVCACNGRRSVGHLSLMGDPIEPRDDMHPAARGP